MKIGVITHWGSLDNYGQTLQTYALQTILTEMGHQPFLIRYKEDGIKRSIFQKILSASNPVKFYSAIRTKRLNRTDYRNNIDNGRDLRKFLDKTVNQAPLIYGREDLLSCRPGADLYITGSDQVWNKLDKSYFLDFVDDNVRKISYAASFGATRYSGDDLKEIARLLASFDSISVREKTGVNICQSIGINNVSVVPDPTILLPNEKYRSIAVKTQRKPYILVYLLGNQMKFDVSAIYRYAKHNDLDVIYVAGQRQVDKYLKEYPDMEKWLGLIDEAECVVTNSFHGTVLSIILNTPFMTIPLAGSVSGMNSRVQNLLSGLSLLERMSIDLNVLKQPVDFSIINKKLESSRKLGLKYLEEATS